VASGGLLTKNAVYAIDPDGHVMHAFAFATPHQEAA
jgi:hypothetical protein